MAIAVPFAFGTTENANTVVDPNTSNNWSSIATSSKDTQNVGRIWTDKSVFNTDYSFEGSLQGQSVSKGDSDFLVGLSAMSSTSNVRSMVTRTQPLDIVLIIDRSSSMRDGIEQAGSYVEVSPSDVVESHGHAENILIGEIAVQDTTGGEYYALVGDEYVRIQEEVRRVDVGWSGTQHYNEHVRWTLNGETVTPENTPFYEYQSGGTISRMEALKTAANNFIDSAAGLPNPEQVRIGVVSFAGTSEGNTASIDRQFTNLSGNNAQTLKNTVNGITAPSSGAGTYPANAFQDAQSMFNGSAQGTQKVVVFFTDGGPGGGSYGSASWDIDNDVANGAINAAHGVKTSGATIYSVGVLDDADPAIDVSNVSDNSPESLRINAFMHAVSSNYPNATGFTRWTIGSRAQNSDYYKAATNASELNNIFNDIFEEIESNQGSGSPIQEEVSSEGAQNTPGNLVFEDQLGSYMQVTGEKMTLVYADGKHESVRSETQGNITTYYFEGTFAGNAIYGAADYSDITVQVEHSTNLATGDKVTVTIPANLIPMRSYNVDTESETPTMTITDAYPVRLFYGVSLKQGAVDAINSGSGTDYDAIMSSQVSEDGTIDFYSNAFANGAPNGLTTATFTPNEANKFYYYTQDTTLYIDQSCSTVATPWNSGNVDTFYYAEPYWERNSDGTAVEHTEGVAITRASRDFRSVETNGRGQLYIPAHTARQDRPHTLDVSKNPNATETASSALVPAWNGGNQSVTQYLGNNGKLSLPAPGQLEIKKSVNWGNASTETQQSKNQFTFTVNLTDAEDKALAGNFSYYINGSDTAAGTVANGGAITITPDQTAVIDGIPAGAKFTVTEQGANSNGFTTTDSYGDNTGNNQSDGKVEGTIVGGSQQSVSFTNTYNAQPVNLSTEATLQVQKKLTGRDWRTSDEFTFEIDGLANATTGATAPEPEQTTVTVTDETANFTAAFGDIQFNAPGEYRYAITEHNDINPIDGIDYSAARYRAVVTVTDNGTGSLVVDSVTIEQRLNDEGVAPGQQPSITNNTMVFTNNYDVSAATTNIDGTKNYTDTTGGNPINADKFTFQLKAVGGFDTATGTAGSYTIDAANVPMPAGADENHTVTTTNTGYGFGFPTISYDGNDVGKTFVYQVTELAGTENGMSYDTTTTHTVRVEVKETKDPEDPSQTIIVATPSMAPEYVVFNNEYNPDDATLTGNAAIHGTKTLTGRDLNDGEAFYFTLEQTGGPATLDPNDDATAFTQVMPDQSTVSVDSLTNGSANFAFGDMTFSQVGTYTYTVNETTADGSETTDDNGLTFSQNVATVSVVVEDNGQGALVATVTYVNSASTETDQAVFTNEYESSMDYGAEGAGGINVTKQLNGRPMAADEFTFTITGQDDAVGMTTDSDNSFANTGAADGETITMAKLQSLTFDQDDAGKTFSFIVDETEGDQTDTKIDYDQSRYRVDITVYDDGLGTMHTVTDVTKIMNADGQEVDDPVVTDADSSAEDYTAPTFGFVNTYAPDSVDVGEDTQNAIQVTKTVTGAPSPDGVNYGFTMTLTSDNADGITDGMTANAEGKLETHVATSGTIAADSSQTVSFGTITFSKPGTYTFSVTEDALAEDTGWTYDTVNTGAKTVTVVVSNMNEQGQYDGSLHIQSVTGNPVQVTNAYKPGEVIVGGDGVDQQITVQKTVTGADSTADFTFQLEPVFDETHTQQWWAGRIETVDPNYNGQETISGVTIGQSKTANFGGIKFKQAGEYQFKITEVGAGENVPAGWTYDTHESFATVTVTDTYFDGSLEASVSYNNENAKTDDDKAVTNAAAFTNSYKADPVTLTGGEATFNGTKFVVGRDWLDNETFGFTMTPVEQDGVDWSSVSYKAPNAEAPAAVTADSSWHAEASENGNASVSFWFAGDFTFTKAGTYTFNVSEDAPEADINGMTYDRHTGVITVTVTDHGNGKLVANAVAGTVAADAEDGSATENDMSFENYYTPMPVVYGDEASEILGGNKNVEDHSGSYVMADDQFTFMMRAQAADNPMPEGLQTSQDDQGRPIVSVTNKNTNAQNNTATFDFGEITFTKAGTYQYNIYENETSMPAGVSPQDSGRTYTITFNVKENTATGELSVDASAVRIGSGDQENTPVAINQINFTNEYDATATSGSAQIFKTLNGRSWQQGDTFTFDVSMTVDGVAADEMPTFNFDNTGATVNDFTSEAGKLSYNVTITPSTSATGNTYAFSTGTATYTHEGTYVYTITERDVDPSVVNVTKDASVYTVTVEVTDVNNDLQRTVTIERNGTPYTETGRVDFTNTYTPTASTDVPANFEFKKVFTGHEWTDNYSFEFTLSPVDGAPMPANDTVTVNAPDQGSTDTATFNFGEIKYDTAGTYKYTVTETNAGTTVDGVTYDGTPAEVTVTVTDKTESGVATGKLVATATVTNGTFENEYNASAEYNASGAGGLDITKQVTNHAMADDQFSFTIAATGDNADAAAKKLGIQNGTTTTVNSAQAAAGVATSVKANPFETMTFNETESGVIYTYTIAENGTSGEGDYAHYVLDDTTHTVSITATDNGNGTMTVVTNVDGTEYTNQRATVAFVNSYKADPTTVGGDDADVTINATKVLANHPLEDGMFTFEVTNAADKSDQPMVLLSGSNVGSKISFNGSIEYTTEKLSADVQNGLATSAVDPQTGATTYTYTYNVSERAVEGVTQNKGSFVITVNVVDDANGTLTASVVYPDGTTTGSLGFENTYGQTASQTISISGTKVLSAKQGLNPPDINGKYTFAIKGVDENGKELPTELMPANASPTNQNRTVDFGSVTYTMENVFGDTGDQLEADGVDTMSLDPRARTFTYTVSESGTVPGVTNDTATKTVTVTVTDNGDGTITAKKSTEGQATDFTFTNVYDVTPETSSLTGDGGFKITKELTSTNTDRKLAVGEFTFELKNADGDVVVSAKNAADGTVSFDGIEFTQPGTYNYTLSEVNDHKAGIDYDDTVYNVTAFVKDKGDGTLEVTWQVADSRDSLVPFENTYTAADTTVTLGGAKVLDGRELAEGEFSFVLKDASGNELGTVKNNAQGGFTFDTITYSEPGTYEYTISEVKGDAEGVTYDETVYNVKVTVEDNGEGNLVVTGLTYNDKAELPVFHNTYTKPEETLPGGGGEGNLPITGDYAGIIAGGIAIVAVGCIGGGVVLSRRRK